MSIVKQIKKTISLDRSLDPEDPPEKGMATRSSILFFFLENSMDRPWGPKSQTQLSNQHFTFQIPTRYHLRLDTTSNPLEWLQLKKKSTADGPLESLICS